MKKLLLTIIYVCVALVACAGESEESDTTNGQMETLRPGEIETGTWAARVTLPGGDIRFVLELGRAEDGVSYTATAINGDERVPVGEVTADGPRLDLFFPAYNSRISAELKNGVLVGTLTLTKRGGVLQNMPFRAEYAQGMVFELPGDAEIDITGRWEVTFAETSGDKSPAIGEFRQQGRKLYGTFLTSTGDYRYLAGDVNGRDINLSCFDGAHAFLFRATLSGTGVLAGDFWSGTQWYESWTATRNAGATLPDPYKLTRLNEGYDRIKFRFPDTRGKMISLDDDRFRDKAVIVVLAGSWCPNCNDEAVFLSEYYRENRSRGLEIVGLMYEHSRDTETARRQIERFGKKNNIEYPLLHAGYSDKKEAQKTLPMLNHVLSFPTTIFIARSGKVQGIYTGFTGPGTGEHYEKFKNDFNDMVNSLLAQ
jgi:peroxiredoxin